MIMCIVCENIVVRVLNYFEKKNNKQNKHLGGPGRTRFQPIFCTYHSNKPNKSNGLISLNQIPMNYLPINPYMIDLFRNNRNKYKSYQE